MAENISVLPIYPLPTVVLPGEPLELHIFEDRFKSMISNRIAAAKNDQVEFFNGYPLHFGVTCSTESSNYLQGCAVSVTRIVQRYQNGNFDIKTKGIRRYSTIEIIKLKPYPQAKVSFFDDIVNNSTESDNYKESDSTDEDKLIDKSDTDLKEYTDKATALHTRLLEIFKGSPPNIFIPEDQPASFYLAHNAGLNTEQKQNLLEMTNEINRLKFIIKHYRNLIPKANQMHEIKTQVLLNGNLKKISGSW